MSKPEYLGDSVYAEFDGYYVILTTNNGYGPSNRIAIEPAVYAALGRYIERMKQSAEQSEQSESTP